MHDRGVRAAGRSGRTAERPSLSWPRMLADGVIHLSYPLAFAAGLVSCLSPCVLPLVPAYLAYLGGRAEAQAPAGAAQGGGGATRREAAVPSRGAAAVAVGAVGGGGAGG